MLVLNGCYHNKYIEMKLLFCDSQNHVTYNNLTIFGILQVSLFNDTSQP